MKHTTHRRWTVEELSVIDEWLDRGFSEARIARRLGVHPMAIRAIRRRKGLPPLGARFLSAQRIANLLGLSGARAPIRWIDRGYLPAERADDRWMVTEEALTAFLQDPAHWHRWSPLRIRHGDLREWALAIRRDESRLLTTAEAGSKVGVVCWTIRDWIRHRGLKAVREGNWYVRESDLAEFMAGAA